MKTVTIEDLGPRQLWKLRKQIVVNSLYYIDYENDYGIDTKEVCDFFNGWLDSLVEDMKEDHPDYSDDKYWDYFPEYDKPSYLLQWWYCWVG